MIGKNLSQFATWSTDVKGASNEATLEARDECSAAVISHSWLKLPLPGSFGNHRSSKCLFPSIRCPLLTSRISSYVYRLFTLLQGGTILYLVLFVFWKQFFLFIWFSYCLLCFNNSLYLLEYDIYWWRSFLSLCRCLFYSACWLVEYLSMAVDIPPEILATFRSSSKRKG